MFKSLVSLVVACATLASAKTVTYNFDIGWVTVGITLEYLGRRNLTTETGSTRWVFQTSHWYQWTVAVSFFYLAVYQY